MSPILLELVPDRSATFTATVIIAGAGIVFLMLVLLIIIFYIFAKVVSSAEAKAKKGKTKKITKSEQKVPAPMPAPVPKASAPQPVVEAGISGEVVAAIAAAVAMSEGNGAVVKSIRKVNVVKVAGRNPWANAAISDNTRPF